MVEALEIILTKERAVLGLSAARHAFAEVNPEIVTPPLVAVDSPSRCHLLSSISADDRLMLSTERSSFRMFRLSRSLSLVANTLPKRKKWALAHQIFLGWPIVGDWTQPMLICLINKIGKFTKIVLKF